MRKFKKFRPVRSRTFRLLLVVAGVFALAAAFAPQANANFCPPGMTCSVIQHFNFNSEPDNTAPPLTSVEGTTTLFNDPAQSFPLGAISVRTGVGTTLNAVPPEPAGGALDVRGNTSGTGTSFCFDIGPMNVSGLSLISVSFAMQSLGNGGQFDFFSLNWSTTGLPGSWTNFSGGLIAINQNGMYNLYTATLALPPGTTTLFLQFCFTGSQNNADQNHTYIDNIEIDNVIPEPATVVGGLLGVLGLGWQQRRRLIRSLRLRRT